VIAPQIFFQSPKSASYDIFTNLDRISSIQVPIFIIHAQDDQEIGLPHSVALFEKCQLGYEPWFVEEGVGHNNIETNQREEWSSRVGRFIREMEAVVNIRAPTFISSTPSLPLAQAPFIPSSSEMMASALPVHRVLGGSARGTPESLSFPLPLTSVSQTHEDPSSATNIAIDLSAEHNNSRSSYTTTTSRDGAATSFQSIVLEMDISLMDLMTPYLNH